MALSIFLPYLQRETKTQAGCIFYTQQYCCLSCLALCMERLAEGRRALSPCGVSLQPAKDGTLSRPTWTAFVNEIMRFIGFSDPVKHPFAAAREHIFILLIFLINEVMGKIMILKLFFFAAFWQGALGCLFHTLSSVLGLSVGSVIKFTRWQRLSMFFFQAEV